jgi:hypothetical protein
MTANTGHKPNLPDDARVIVKLRNGALHNWPVGGRTRWTLKPEDDASRVADIVEWEVM